MTASLTTADSLLEVQDLHLSYRSGGRSVWALQGVSLQIRKGEIIGLVGESGSGKSTLARAVMGLLPVGRSDIEGGAIRIGAKDVTRLSSSDWEALRGSPVAMIFQDSLSILNPVMRIDWQIAEAVRRHEPKRSRRDSAQRVMQLLEMVQLPSWVGRAYPFQLSGGMRQRVSIAIALGCRPQLLVADEPTTALDVTTQAGILWTLNGLCRSNDMALLLITHDLGVVRALCDRIYVMYAGQVVEWGRTADVLHNPGHPYMEGLLRAALTVRDASGHFPSIPGEVPNLTLRVPGCPFAPRCPRAMSQCLEAMPPAFDVKGDGHKARCWLRAPDVAGQPAR